MDLVRIEKLIDRYWACVSTVDEESELRAFFKSENVPEHLLQIKPLFSYYEKEKRNSPLGTEFDQVVIDKVKKQKSAKVIKLSRYFNNYVRVAAVVLIVVTASFVYRMEYFSDEKAASVLVDTYDTPEEAYLETKKALMLIASKMNAGKKEALKLGAFNQAEEKVRNTNM